MLTENQSAMSMPAKMLRMENDISSTKVHMPVALANTPARSVWVFALASLDEFAILFLDD